MKFSDIIKEIEGFKDFAAAIEEESQTTNLEIEGKTSGIILNTLKNYLTSKHMQSEV